MIRLKVREIAQSKKISQRRLSRLADIDLRTVQRIWSDPYKIVTTETLDKIAKVLGVNASELIDSEPE
jgi:DNA-binding Xre family transcriptional regulator